MPRTRIPFLAILACTLAAATPWNVNLNLGTKITVVRDGQPLMDIAPTVMRPGWKAQNVTMKATTPQRNGHYEGISGAGPFRKTPVNLTMDVRQDSSRSLTIACTFIPQQDTQAHSLNITANLTTQISAGCTLRTTEGKQLALPEKNGPSPHVFRNSTAGITIASKLGDLRLSLDPKNTLLIQDNRTWNVEFFVLRYSVPPQPDTLVTDQLYLYKAGTPYQAHMTILFPEDIKLNENKMVVMKADKTWIPLQSKLDILKDSALDFTRVVNQDAPAGKYGWTVTRGQNFEFEGRPGKPQRFYGVNLCMDAQNLTHEQSDRLAERLARFGYNAVRLHHHENVITGFNRQSSLIPRPETLDRFFYLFAALKKRGIYVTTDVYVSRRVTASEIYPGEKGFIAMNEFKQLCAVHPRARENWKAFARVLLGTVNPYTGLTLAQDPALNLISMVNEGALNGYSGGSTFPHRLHQVWLQAWNQWLQQHAPTPQQRLALGIQAFPETRLPSIGSFGTKKGNAYAHFLYETHQKMYRDMTSFMRDELKSKALFTDINNAGQTIWAQLTRNSFDYVDHHFYVDHPSFLDRPWKLPSTCPNLSVISTGKPGGHVACLLRNLNKPFTITEWNYCAPGKYRSIGGLMTGALAAIQNWAGLWRFTYSQSNNMFAPQTRPAGYFEVVADPVAQITERATLCLFRRQDLNPAAKTIALTVSTDWLKDKAAEEIKSLEMPWAGYGLVAKTGTMVGHPDTAIWADVSIPLTKQPPYGTMHLKDLKPTQPETTRKLTEIIREQNWMPQHNLTDASRNVFQTADGQVTVDASSHQMTVNTPRTAGGFAEAGKTIRTDVATFAVNQADATVWLSSLTEQPIRTADRLLLSHVTELHCTGATYAEEDRKTVLNWGKPPFLVRNGSVTALLSLNRPEQFQVYSIDLAGNRIQRQPATVKDGRLCLTLNIDHSGQARLLYELIRIKP